MIRATPEGFVIAPSFVTKHHLNNYLRTERRRRGLRQRHVAYLLGSRTGEKVSRYENFSRLPDIRTVFALEAIYGIPASKLFAGIFDEARVKVEEHAFRALNGDDAALASFARVILSPTRSRPPESLSSLA
jgi:transcriptional regulator with XRE-family HTH domain